ncbi:DUF599 domain-containing protein [Halovulum dunhuangense]|uniref:DUF599 domain-containing protein n=1 Tax=Halovulum dunhuangense TaxID=1505036 RepID=A0A849KYP8_9RHOB|nr:DUF599 domain-containing protein [Halovulum dunhuangense]NNU78832.1 DUF599 domain-containing protein [Halovulum dunhuangense]
MPDRALTLMQLFAPLDWAALVLLLGAMLGATLLIEHPPARRLSTHVLMRRYRREWMLEMAARDVRIFDSQVLAILRQGSSFFASTTLIVIGGGAALLGQPERLRTVALDIVPELTGPLIVWEIKLLVVLLVLLAAFLKFVWAIRLFGYCAVMIASVPNTAPDTAASQDALALARRAGEIGILAERSFNRGLRAVYFSLASMAWLLGPEALIAATLFTLGILWRREFGSRTRAVLLADDRPPR